MHPELDPDGAESVIDLAQRAKTAARRIARLATSDKNHSLTVSDPDLAPELGVLVTSRETINQGPDA